MSDESSVNARLLTFARRIQRRPGSYDLSPNKHGLAEMSMNRWLADRTCLEPTRIFIQSDLIGKQGRLVVPPSMFVQSVEPFVAP